MLITQLCQCGSLLVSQAEKASGAGSILANTVKLCPDSLVHNTHCTGRTLTVQSCTLYSTSGNLPDQIRQHQISMFQSLHSGIQESTEYNKKPLTNERELFQSPSIKADQKSSKTSVSWELSRNSLWSRVLLPTPNTLSGIAQVWR